MHVFSPPARCWPVKIPIRSLTLQSRGRLSAFPHPLRKLLPLLSDIDKPGSTLQDAERIPNKILLNLAISTQESILAFALNLASPNTPLDRSQFRSAENEAEADGEDRYNCFYGDVERERSDGWCGAAM